MTASSGLGKRTFIGAVWSQFGAIGNIVLLFAFNLLVTRQLPPSAKGAFDVYTAIMSVAVLIGQGGLNLALIRFAPETNSLEDAPRRRILFLKLLRSRWLICLAMALATALFHAAIAEALAAPLFGQTWPFFIVALFGNQTLDLALAGLQSALRLRALWLLQIARVSLNIALCAGVFLWLGTDPAWVVVVMSFSAAATALAGLWYTLRTNPPALPHLPITRPDSRAVYRYALGAWLISLTTFGLANQSDVLLINLLLRDTAQVAFYNTAYLLATQIAAVLSGWSTVMMPAITAALEQRGPEGIRRAWKPLAQAQILAYLFVFLLAARAAPDVVALLFGPAYAASGPLLAGLCALFGVMHLVTISPYHMLFVSGRMRALWITRAMSGLLSIALNIALIPLLGVWGTVIATSSGFALALGIEFVLAQRAFGLEYPWSFTARVSAAALAAILSTLWVGQPLNLVPASPPASMVVLSAQSIGVFTLLLALLKPFRAEDLSALSTLPAPLRATLRHLARP